MMQKQRNRHSHARYDDGQSKHVHVCINVCVNCLFVQCMLTKTWQRSVERVNDVLLPLSRKEMPEATLMVSKRF